MSQSEIELRIIEYEKTIFQLKNQIDVLEENNRTLKCQCSDTHLKTNTIIRLEANIRTLNDLVAAKEDKIFNLKNEQLKLQKEFNRIKRATETKYELELKFYKALQENNTTVVESANMASKLNEIQHHTILQLENKIDEIYNEEDRVSQAVAIKHENQFTNLKKKMMDHIKVAQKNMAQANLDNMDLNSKLSKLTTNQLLIELEEQSLQIEELLKEKEKLQKTIFALKTDITTHKKVEQLLQEKNQKYYNMVKTLNEQNIKQQQQQQQQQDQVQQQPQQLQHKHKEKSSAQMRHTISSGFNISSTEPNNSNNTAKGSLRKLGEHINYEELYHKKNKDYENLKGHYECLRDKEKNNDAKYSNIMKIYKRGFEDLINDEELKNKEDLHVNIKSIQDCDYLKLNKEQQYTIMVYLIKHLFPLIQNPDDEFEEFKSKIDKINLNFNKTHSSFRQMKDNSYKGYITSRYDFKKQFPDIRTATNFNHHYH